MIRSLLRWALPACLVLAGCDAPEPGSAASGPTIAAEPAPAAAEPASAVTALKEVEAPPSALKPAVTEFTCTGADPAWSLQVATGTGWLRLPEGDTELAGTLKETSTGAYTWLGIPADDPARSVALLIVPDHCFPADGGAALPFTAQLSLADGSEVGGCCIPSPGD